MRYIIKYSKKFRGFITHISIQFMGKDMMFQVYAKNKHDSLYMACDLYKDLLLLEQKYARQNINK